MTKFKGFDSNSEKAKKFDCQFTTLHSIFTGKNPELDKIARQFDNFVPTHAIAFVLNNKDKGFLFFNKTQSSIAWVGEPRTVHDNTQAISTILAMGKKYLKSFDVVIMEY